MLRPGSKLSLIDRSFQTGAQAETARPGNGVASDASSRVVQAVESLPRSRLLGGLLRAPRPHSGLDAVDHRRAREGPVVRRALHLEHRVGHLAAPAGELLLELGLVVDMGVERVADPTLEGGDHRAFDLLE